MQLRRDLSEREFERALDELAARRSALAGPFDDVSDEARAERRRRAAEDPIYFAYTYLPHFFDTDPAEFHRELVSLATLLCVPVVVSAPRGHGKSSWVAVAVQLWKILTQPTAYFTLFASYTLDLAVRKTRTLREELWKNDRILIDFGRQAPTYLGDWEAGEFVVYGAPDDPRRKKILAVSPKTAMRGVTFGAQRPDNAVLDDPEEDEQARSARRTRALLDWIKGSLYPSLDRRKGALWCLLWIGTPINRRSALSQVLADKESQYARWRKARYRAIQPDGSVLCPALFDLATLNEIKGDIGSRLFNAEYGDNPEDEEGCFRSAWVTRFDPRDVPDSARRFIFCDPSLGKKNSDYSALVCIAVHESIRYVIGVRIARLSPSKLVSALFEGYEAAGRPLAVGVEANGFQSLLVDLIAAEGVLRGYQLPVQAITNTKSKEARIESLSVPFELGHLRFLAGDADTEELLEQFIAYPEGHHDDGPDACAGAYRMSMDSRWSGEFKFRAGGKREFGGGLKRADLGDGGRP